MENNKSIFQKIKDAWVNRKTLAEDSNAKKDVNSFLPGVLEVTDRPPNPLVRRVSYFLISLLILVVVWAFFFRIDIVTVGQGKIVPAGDIKTIQSPEKGTVVSLNVDSGQIVHKGDVLIVLESEYTESDVNKLKEDVEFYKLKISREETLFEMIKSNNRDLIPLDKLVYNPPNDITDKLDIEQSKRLLWQQWQTGIAKLKVLEAALNSRKQEREISINRTHQLEQMLKIIKEKLDTYTKLYKKKAVSRMEYLEFREKFINTYFELETEKGKDMQLDAEIVEAQSNLQSYKSEAYLDILQNIRQDRKDLYTAEQELRKATTLNGKNIIKAPVNGIVHELKIHTVGAVVTPAEVLMQIVPIDQKLKAEVYVKNMDIGYLKKGQKTQVKIDTYPFAEYGVLHGTVEKISGDAIDDEKLGLVYKLIINLEDNTLHRDGTEYSIVPGMSIMAEVKTGSRRVLDFFTEPLTRGIDNSLRER